MSNHRSLRDEQELLLMPQYEAAGQVVPVAAVYGANASGKSNLVGALRWMKSAVLESFRVWEAGTGVPRLRYQLDADEARPSSYVVDLILDGVQWVYGFVVDSETVREEWLHTYPHGRERVVFERQGQDIELGSTVPERRSRTDLLQSLLRDNALLLSTASQANQPEARPVYEWFRNRLFYPRSWATPEVGEEDLSVLFNAAHRHPEFVELLRAADFGIKGLAIDVTVGPNPQTRVRVRHGETGAVLDLSSQSSGTLAWAELVYYSLGELAGGGLMVVDEIDASLHPRLTARLMELFRSPETNAKGAQLLFTTHDATLLGTSLGGEVLRRDEIWFVEKQDGVSRLYPLSDFHPRKGENRERRYLAGSYGAVPVVFEDSLVEAVLAARTGAADDPA